MTVEPIQSEDGCAQIDRLLAQLAEIDHAILQMTTAGQTQQLNVLLRAKQALCEALFGLISEASQNIGLRAADELLEALRGVQASHERVVRHLATAKQAAGQALAAAQKQKAAVTAYTKQRAA